MKLNMKFRGKSRKSQILITPRLIRETVARLQMRRAYVKFSSIARYLRRFYPVQENSNAFDRELEEKIECAVCVGLLTKHGIDKYSVSTLRQEAYSSKTALSAFWEMYKHMTGLRNRRKTMQMNKRLLEFDTRNCETDSFNSDESISSEGLGFASQFTTQEGSDF